jgi:hypothetical protein
MTSDGWIVVPNWAKFQHYGNRRDAPWIKVYGELNSRDEWRRLPYSERGLLVTIWIEYQRSGGQLNVSDIGLRGGQRVRLRSLEALNHAGFIEVVASKPLALRALAREEVREEKKEHAHARETRTPKPAPSEPRINATAYRKHNPDPQPERFVPLEQIEAYALKLRQRDS